MSMAETHRKYDRLSPGLASEDDYEATARFLRDTSPGEARDWSEERMVKMELGGQAYRMLIDRPDEVNVDEAIIFPMEFGNDEEMLGQVLRARVIRDLVVPGAQLIGQPNATLWSPGMNLSADERKIVRQGSAAPFVDRIVQTADQELNSPGNIAVYGPSMGATTGLAYAAHANTPRAAVAIIETPNIVKRSGLSAASAFLSSGKDLDEYVAGNFEGPESPLLQRIKKYPGLARFAIGAVGRMDNIASIYLLNRASAQSDMRTILDKGGSLAHAWGARDRVSPAEANRIIASGFSDHYSRYLGIELRDKTGPRPGGEGHGITNNYTLNAGLVRQALSLYA